MVFLRVDFLGRFYCTQNVHHFIEKTSNGGNGNHSISLPIILIKIKVDQIIPSSYISLLLVSSV